MTAHPSAFRVGEPVKVIKGSVWLDREGVVERVESREPQAYVPYVVDLGDGHHIAFSHVSLEAIDGEWIDYRRAIEIANEISAIGVAIEEGRVGAGNVGIRSWDFYSTRLFRGLSGRRERLRAELLELGPEVILDKPDPAAEGRNEVRQALLDAEDDGGFELS